MVKDILMRRGVAADAAEAAVNHVGHTPSPHLMNSIAPIARAAITAGIVACT